MKKAAAVSLEALFKGCNDVVIKTSTFGDQRSTVKITMAYCTVLVDSKYITKFILPAIQQMALDRKASIHSQFEDGKLLEITPLPFNDDSDLEQQVFDGQLLIYLHQNGQFFTVDISNTPNRTPEESSMEVTVMGAKDGFTEDLRTNVGLIRKRIRSRRLSYEEYEIGATSRVKVGLLFLSDLVQPEIAAEVRKRLTGIKAEAPTLSMLKEALSDRTFILFPVEDSTQRPDLATACLLNSRFVIVMDGVPTVLVTPVTLFELLKSAEDSYFPFLSAVFQRALRVTGLAMALLLPGLWIAVTSFHPEQLPILLMATVAMGRYGIPYSNTLEAFLMQFMFELFREAGLRLPKAVGQTVAVVGGLMVGDAAIRAGLTSPSMLVVTAVSAVASFTLINPGLTITVTVLKFVIMFCSSVLGLFGFFLSIFGLCIYLVNLRCFGIPYLKPVAPLIARELLSALLSKPSLYDDDKPSMITRSASLIRKVRGR